MNSESNIQVIRKLFAAVNEKNWPIVETCFHKDFPDEKIILNNNPNWKETSLFNFLKILGLDPVAVLTDLADYRNKKEYTHGLIKFTKTFANWRIDRIVADKGKVWLTRTATIIDPQNLGVELQSLMEFWMRDNKVVRLLESGFYLNSLLQYGEIIMNRNIREELDHYLYSLKELGLLPDNVKIKQ